MLGERKPPTHVLQIEVPLNLDEPPHDYDAIQDVVRVCLSVSHAVFAGHVCDASQVTLIENPAWPHA